MKLTLILSAAFSLSTLLSDITDRLGIKGPLTFSNTKLELAWSDNPSENYYVQEYIPKGEQLEKFTQMLIIQLFDNVTLPQDAVQQKMKWLEKRKSTDAICNYKISESPDGKEFILDFLVGESTDGKMTIAEFNVYHYKRIEIDGRGALLVITYSKRSYGDNITPFLATLRADRNLYLNEMISFSLPSLKILN